MDFLLSLFKGTGIATTILFISLTAFIGVLLGKITIKNVKLGVAGVLFSGLFFAHFGAKVDAHVLHFVREFGLILFIYTVSVLKWDRVLSTHSVMTD